ncbi:MAG: PAS domain-containing protein [Bdellovibrio sp.]|nr:PAS domain-containing protein [Bdellovibrio sp.]
MKNFSLELFEKYQKALGSASMGLWEWNLSDNKVRWDIGMQKLYQIPDEITESDIKNWYERVHPDDRKHIRTNLELAISDKIEIDSMFRVTMPDSSIRYMRTNAYKVRNEKNEVISLVGLNWDVTHEAILQNDLAHTKSFLENMMNALPDPLFVKDSSYRWIFANSEFEKIVGETKEQFLGKTDYDFFSTERADGYRMHDKLVFKTGLSREIDEKVTNTEGETREILTKKSLFKLSDENFLVGVMRDITEKNKTDSQFRLMISLIDSSVDLFGFTDVTGVPLYVNKTGIDIFGIEVGKNFFTDYLSPLHKQLVDAAISKGLHNFENWEGEVQVLNPKTQQEIPILLKIFSVRTGPRSSDVFYGCSGTNLTEVKKIQQSLIEQSKMASLGEMAAEIAHEVNNPLMIIQAKAQMLQEKIGDNHPEKEKFIKDLQLIEKNSGRIDKIIRSLKTASRRSEQDPLESIAILTIIDEALELSKQRFRINEVVLSLKVSESCDYNNIVFARSTEIVQVLVNLLNNSFDAVKNQEHKWVEINLSCDELYYNISVTDSGEKIPKEISARMFNPFYTTKPSGQGTGLGLSLSKQIIQNHGGEFFYDDMSVHTQFGFKLRKPEYVR